MLSLAAQPQVQSHQRPADNGFVVIKREILTSLINFLYILGEQMEGLDREPQTVFHTFVKRPPTKPNRTKKRRKNRASATVLNDAEVYAYVTDFGDGKRTQVSSLSHSLSLSL